MAYESVKNQIDAYIKANGVNLITGPVLNAVLTTMLDELGEGYAFQGVLNTTDTPSPAADIPQAWLASAGTYLGGSITVDEDELALIIHTADGWSKETVYRGIQLSYDAIVEALGYTPADEANLAEKQDTIADLTAIRSGAALGSTSVQPADIEDMVEAEPIGSIIPPVNPSEFATKEELSQLSQDVYVGEYVQIRTEATRNIRPMSGGILVGNNDYAYIAEVSYGDEVRILAHVRPSDYMRVGFTAEYPVSGSSVSGYFDKGGGSDGASLSFVRTAPVTGYIVVSCASDFDSIEIGKKVTGTVGAAAYKSSVVDSAVNAIELVKANDPINYFDKDSDGILHGYYIIDGKYASAGGYAITHPIYVKAGVQYKYPHDSGWISTNYLIAVCDPDGEYIKNIVGIFSDGYVTFTPAEDCFVRLNIGRAANIYSFMVCNAEDYPASYVPFARSIGDNYHLGETQINDVREIVAPFQQVVDHFVTEKSVNLFNKASALIKNGYYIGGRLISNESYRVTHPIKVSAGVSYKAVSNDLGTSNTGIAVVDGDNNILYFVNGVVSGNYITITPAEDCYLSFNIGQYARLDEMMVCIEADYPESYEPYYEYTKLVGVEVESASSPLTGKSVIFTGDSICYGATDTPQGAGWAKRIGEKNNMGWQNKAVSGGTIMNKDLIGSSFTICDTDFGTGADYIILEGGTNDADRIGSITGGNTPQYYGSWNESDYVTEFGKDTFCDAVQRLIQRVVTSFPTARVGFIIAPKMGVSNSGFDAAHNNRRAYFQTIIEICRKWGVPVLNLWDECTMNPRLAAHYTEAEHGPLYHDGQHPTAEGYELITPIIEKWMESL